jgi:predicted O-linked N-acetylglucosamine transferase (SPINDLY family)
VAGQAEAWHDRRRDIRHRLAASPLCDGAGRARQVERLFRAVWRRRCATAAAPESSDGVPALFAQAIGHHEAGRLVEAEALYRRILARDGEHVDSMHLLGVLCRCVGRRGIAVELITHAIRRRPDFAAAYSNLGNALNDLGHAELAGAAYLKAIVLEPDYFEAYSNLGNALKDLGRPQKAASMYGRAIRLRPRFAGTHADLALANSNLALACFAMGRLDDGISACRRSLALNPGAAAALDLLAWAHQEQGSPDRAVEASRRAVDADQGNAMLHSNLLLRMQLLPSVTTDAMYAEITRWRLRHGRSRGGDPCFPACREPDRRLRIAYVSGYLEQLGERPNALWLQVLPLLKSHDRNGFEIFVYGDCRFEQANLQPVWPLATAWRTLAGLDDEAAARIIRADGIDILICLIGHTARERMTLFTWRPAPVQINFHGMFSSGVADMDYWLTDACLSPFGSAERFDETVVRLPQMFVFAPLDWAPPVTPLPALEPDRGVTFGCFNQTAKISGQALCCFAAILRAVPGARLVLKSRNSGYGAGSVREIVRGRLEGLGITPDRVTFLPKTDSLVDHLACYGGIDIALDTFPYCGCLTTYDALWMGVPTVTVSGDRFVYRMSQAVLETAGVEGLVAASPDEYVAKAVALAGDLDSLAALRASLRERVRASRLCDEVGYTRSFEAVLRAVWRKARRTPT